MTVSSEVSSVSHAGDGVSTAFTVPFRFLSPNDLQVRRRNADGSVTLLTTGFSITGGDPTGLVTFDAAPEAGTDIIIDRAPQLLQPAAYPSNDKFPAATHEMALDRLTYQTQWLRRQLEYTLRFPFADGSAGIELPSAPNRASKYLAFDADGNPEVADLVEGTITRSIIGQLLYPQTEGEQAAGVTPTNYAYPPLDLRRYGADPSGQEFSTTAILDAVKASRKYAEERLDTIGGDTITMYRASVIELPEGIFKIEPDVLEVTQDMGITFRGRGSRRFTNAIRGATTILVSGTSSGFGIKLYRNGARSVHFEDLDICYEDASFTGHLIDIMASPGLKFRRCYLGTFGITGGTRVQTAASLLRLTYHENVTLEDCTLDGAVDGVWIDDVREELSNSFGGWGVVLQRCTFYDFTGTMVRHDGNRATTTVTIQDSHFNPIQVDCKRAIDLNNVNGLNIIGNIFTPSTSAKATDEWMRVVNVTGQIKGNSFSDLTKAGTINGCVEVSSNLVFGTDGFTLTGGIIRGGANEFSQGNHGWTITPSEALCVDIGPDWFKSGITGNSYRIAADSAFLAGRINYDATRDGSGSKFTNVSDRISILNVDQKYFSVNAATYNISILDTGRRVVATGNASGQAFTLPTPVHGCEIEIMKQSTNALSVTAGSAIILTGFGSAKTTLAAANASDVGGTLRFRARGSTWVLVNRVGDWTAS